MKTAINDHIDKAAIAFDRQAPVFDQLYNQDTIIQYKRQRVRDHLEQLLQPNSLILELNAGTGEDAIYLAKKGHRVHATDISSKMQEELRRKLQHTSIQHLVSQEKCSYTNLDQLQYRARYDHVLSNFAGLNCTHQLDKVLTSLPSLVKPGGKVTLVVLPVYCLWEWLLVFKGKFKTAFRRFAGKKGARAHIEGQYFRCWYYHPSFIEQKLSPWFDQLSIEGLCTIVPPSYMEGFAQKHPRIYTKLVAAENKFKKSWPWKYIGDYYIISFSRKEY